MESPSQKGVIFLAVLTEMGVNFGSASDRQHSLLESPISVFLGVIFCLSQYRPKKFWEFQILEKM
jgi:hypothetical protein